MGYWLQDFRIWDLNFRDFDYLGNCFQDFNVQDFRIWDFKFRDFGFQDFDFQDYDFWERRICDFGL